MLVPLGGARRYQGNEAFRYLIEEWLLGTDYRKMRPLELYLNLSVARQRSGWVPATLMVPEWQSKVSKAMRSRKRFQDRP
jgi:hypothetical protein